MLLEYLLFLAEVVTGLVALLLLLLGIVVIVGKAKQTSKREELRIEKINEKFEEITKTLREATLSKEAFKKIQQEEKRARKAAKKEESTKKRVFLLKFDGDIKASAVNQLREEITAILTVATPADEVVVVLESTGGMIHAYGLASSQLGRIRTQKIPLTVIVDKVAASGGYMMACVANRVIAAPFAILGSVGVIAQLPNFNRFLKKKDIDFEQITAGQYKRTLTVFGENTDAGREKFQAEIDEAHQLFKTFVAENRPVVKINEIATGEHWFGLDALKHHLVDAIGTSDDYLLAASKDADIFEIQYVIPKKKLVERLVQGAQAAYTSLVAPVAQ